MTRILMITVMTAFLASPVSASTLSIAQKYIGMSERGHRAALKRMIGVDPRRIPWCGAFMGAVVRKAGRKPPKASNLARSWLRFGKPVRISQARPGDIVVLGRKRGGHVGFLHSRKSGKVCLVGGNQSNRVQVSCYPMSRIKGVRR